jgi:hypothetical protein
MDEQADVSPIITQHGAFMCMPGAVSYSLLGYSKGGKIIAHPDLPKANAFKEPGTTGFTDRHEQQWRIVYKLGAKNPLPWYVQDGEQIRSGKKPIITWDKTGVFYVSSTAVAATGYLDGSRLVHGNYASDEQGGADGDAISIVMDVRTNDIRAWIRDFMANWAAAAATNANKDKVRAQKTVPIVVSYAPRASLHRDPSHTSSYMHTYVIPEGLD